VAVATTIPSTSAVFFTSLASVDATLMGLLFVAVSFNAEAILGPARAHAKSLAERAFFSYFCVLVVALLVLFPGLAIVQFGVALIGLGSLYLARVLLRLASFVRGGGDGQGLWLTARRYSSTLLGFALLIYAGRGGAAGRFVAEEVGGALMFLICSATVVSWELLINVAEERFRNVDA
jgi:hypothetical protein